MHFPVVFVLYDMKMHSSLTPIKFKRSKSFSDLCQRSLVCRLTIFSKDFSSETTGPISIKFAHAVFRQRGGGGGSFIFIPVYMTKIAVMSMY